MTGSKPQRMQITYAADAEGRPVPVIDITSQRFALPEDDEFLRKLQSDYIERESRQARVPWFLQRLMMKFAARNSEFLHALVEPNATYLDGLTTYLMKLGHDSLPDRCNSDIDRKIAAAPHVIAMRLRLQQCALLLADCLRAPLQSAHAPLHLINIGGGTAIDSINALLALHRDSPHLLERPIAILVFDQNPEAPAFGARAISALCQPGHPLAGRQIDFQYKPYDWNRTGILEQAIQKSVLQGAFVAASSEGALFEYGDDAATLANLRALHASGHGAHFVVGSVTCDDELRRTSLKQNGFSLVPRKLEVFADMAKKSGYELVRSTRCPLSEQVLLRASPGIPISIDPITAI